MLNPNKENEFKDKAFNLAENVRNNAEQVGTDVRNSAENISSSAHQKSLDTKHEAANVIDSLKALLAQYTNSTNVNELKNQILDKAYELKGTVHDEVLHAYEMSRDRTAQTVQDKPLATLGLAVGAGLLLGYILGSKQSHKSY